MKKTKENGITLISLVVTVIILIILAGVSISLVVGGNGLFAKAQESVRKTEIAQVKENIRLDLLNLQTEKEDNNFILEESDIESVLKKYGTITKNEDGSIKSLTPTGKNYEISYEELQIGLLVTGDSDKDHNTGSGSGGTTGGSQDKVEITREEYDALVERLNAIDGGTKSSVSLSDVNNSIDSKTADIKTNIAEMQKNFPNFHKVDYKSEFNVNKLNELYYIGQSYTIPKNSYYSLSFALIYNYNPPDLIIISTSTTTPSSSIAEDGRGYSHAFTQMTGFTDTALTLYVWGKFQGEKVGTIDTLIIRGYYVTFPE